MAEPDLKAYQVCINNKEGISYNCVGIVDGGTNLKAYQVCIKNKMNNSIFMFALKHKVGT